MFSWSITAYLLGQLVGVGGAVSKKFGCNSVDGLGSMSRVSCKLELGLRLGKLPIIRKHFDWISGDSGSWRNMWNSRQWRRK
jgi:hypothetical protein